MTASAHKFAIRHPFGGCNRLLDQYRVIGRELLLYERERRQVKEFISVRRRTVSKPLQDFRAALSLIPLEVLESYLDDLLDPAITNEALYIGKSSFWRSAIIPFFGLTVALGIGLLLADQGSSFWLSFVLTILLAIPSALCWYFYPQGLVSRRMMFAQLLSQEIYRRRGFDTQGRAKQRPRVIIPFRPVAN